MASVILRPELEVVGRLLGMLECLRAGQSEHCHLCSTSAVSLGVLKKALRPMDVG